MASIPSLYLPSPLKLEPAASKLPSLCAQTVIDKSLAVSYPRESGSAHLDGKSETRRPLDISDAFSLIEAGRNIRPHYYVPLLQHCAHSSSILEIDAVHAHMMKAGILRDSYGMTSLLNVYSKCGHMEMARSLFDFVPVRTAVSWNALVTGYAQESKPDAAVEVFVEMLESGSLPTDFTIGVVVSACTSLNSVKLGRQVHGFMVKYGVDYYTSVGNALCSMYSKVGSLGSAIKAFRKISDKDVISWTAMITACSDNGEATKGLRYFTDMLLSNTEPNHYTLASVMSLCSSLVLLEAGKQIHAVSFKLGHGSNQQITNSAMYLYLKCGNIGDGMSLFKGTKSCSLVTYNTMIAGHAQAMELAKDDIFAHHCGMEALRMYKKLHTTSMRADLFSLSSILSVCTRLSSIQQGEQIHAHAVKSGFLSDVVVGTALVNMYNKCGSIDLSTKAFSEMIAMTLISWTTMIASYAQHGMSQHALQAFDDMLAAGIRPNAVTFVSVLSACSYAGKVDEAREYFSMMQGVYKIEPVVDHYGCMVDMFVRLGRLEEAFDVVKKMEVDPNEFIWLMLISGARIQGNHELGFFAAEQLVNLPPKDADTWVKLLNVYVSSERWKDVSRVRKLMKEAKIGKLKDWSWITIRNRVHTFTSNGPPCADLDALVKRAIEFGYEPSADPAEAGHSERLAVAFGVLNVQTYAPIRVVKNRVVCKDCHNLFKSMSLSENRKIIIRDTTRLHVFENGHCSCADSCVLV